MSSELRVIIAARLSRKSKGKRDSARDGIGIETQDEYSREWCEREGMHVVATVADTVTGTKAPFDRKHLGKWVSEESRLAEYDAIVAYKNDRLSRAGWRDEARIRMWAEDNGKRLIIVDGPQWPPRHDGDRWSWEAMSIQARKEWESIRERSMRAQKAIHESGGLVGRVPWGYTSEGEEYAKTIVATEAGRLYVPEIFRRLWEDKASLGEIAEWLTEATGGDWYPRTVGGMIRNETYAGRHLRTTEDGTEYVLACEPLIDDETFARANSELDGRPGRGAPRPEGRALLSSVAKCARCAADGIDSPMYRIYCTAKRKDGTLSSRIAYYRCTGKGPVRTRKGCGNMVRCEAADRLAEVFFSGLTAEITEYRAAPVTDYDKLIATAKRDLKNLDPTEDDFMAEVGAAKARIDSLISERDRQAGRSAEATPVGVGESYAQRWNRLETPERNTWMRKSGMRVYLGGIGDEELPEYWGEIGSNRQGETFVPGDRMAALFDLVPAGMAGAFEARDFS